MMKRVAFEGLVSRTQAIGFVLGMSAVASACARDTLNLAPPSYSQPWVVPAAVSQSSDNGLFSVPSDPAAAILTGPVAVRAGHAYTLPELIDIAQQNNPETRIAWQQARQAALAVGMGEATFLPMISASVIGGYQDTHTPLPYDLNLDTSGSAIVPALALQWLMFDFGQRKALVEAARHTSYATNVTFNAVHQKLIYDVTRTYYQYGAALERTRISESMLRNSRLIQDAAEQRMKRGIATSVEVALSRQQVAQSELRKVTAAGMERDAYQALLSAMGVSPLENIEVTYPQDRQLPKASVAPTEEMIRLALSQRPDVLASYAGTKAAAAAIKAVKAGYLPKVYLAGALAGGDGHFDLQGLPAIGPQTSSSSILIGVTVPLYDGGLRAARVKEAESRAEVAAEAFKKTQDVAVREIVVASDVLNSALQSNQAALTLVDTAFVSYDAALDAYRNGLSTVTVANEAANGLLEAQQISVDAHAAALVAAASLAFVMGKLTQSP